MLMLIKLKFGMPPSSSPDSKKTNGKQKKLYYLCETIRLPFRCFVESTLFTSLRRKNAIRHSHFEPGHQVAAKTVSITRVQKNIETNGTKPC